MTRVPSIFRLALLPALFLLPACGGAPEPAPAPAGPVDPVAVDAAHYTVVMDNPSVRVLRISYGPGESSTMHHHPDAIAVGLSDSTYRFTLPDGSSRDATLAMNSALYTPAETHNPTNTGTARTDIVLVEFKGDAPGMAMLPTGPREGVTMTMLAEGPRATAWHAVSDPKFAEPEGTTHEYDQVVIALGDGNVELTINGTVARSTWTRGDAEFIGRGVPHHAVNRGGTPVEYVMIGIK